VTKICAALTVALLLPPAAAAHLRTGTVAVDFRTRIVTRPTGPVSVGVYESDRALSALPGTVVGLVGALAIGAGLAGAVTGCIAYVRTDS